MTSPAPFKWRHFQSDLILLNVRWYLRYSLSYRDLAEMMLERGVKVAHTTLYRWVQVYRTGQCRPYLKPTNDAGSTKTRSRPQHNGLSFGSIEIAEPGLAIRHGP